MSETAHLHELTKDYLHRSDEERIALIEQGCWIGYPRAQAILKKLEDLVRHPRVVRMPNLFIVGDSNNGKTDLVQHFLNQHPAQENPHGEHITAPVMYVQAPPSPSEAGLYAEILTNLFERIPAASPEARRARTISVLEGVQLKVLVIDELHNLLAGSKTKQLQLWNALKYLGNELRISIVGCGTGDLARAAAIDPQIQNRFTPVLLPKWGIDKEFRQLLMSFERTLPLRNPSNLHEITLANKIHAMSEGTIGETWALLKRAAIYAVQHGDEQITAGVLNKSGYISPSDRNRSAARA
jgi:hypothetical protein